MQLILAFRERNNMSNGWWIKTNCRFRWWTISWERVLSDWIYKETMLVCGLNWFIFLFLRQRYNSKSDVRLMRFSRELQTPTVLLIQLWTTCNCISPLRRQLILIYHIDKSVPLRKMRIKSLFLFVVFLNFLYRSHSYDIEGRALEKTDAAQGTLDFLKRYCVGEFEICNWNRKYSLTYFF